jgi:hypothetical protein
MALLKQTAALTTILSLLAAPAFAAGAGHVAYGNQGGYGNGGSWYGQLSMTLVFDSIVAKEERGELTVRYRVQPQSFFSAQRVAPVPRLVAAAPAPRFEARVDRQEGVFKFDLPRPGNDRDRRDDERRDRYGWYNGNGNRFDLSEITISLIGRTHRYKLDAIQLNGRVGGKITVAVESGRRPGHGNGHGNGHQAPRWSMQPAVIQACGYAMEGQYNEMQCLSTADAFAFNPAATINACEANMEGDASELSCIQTAARSQVERLPALQACEAAMEGDANELACFAKAVTASFAAAPTINACEAAFDGDFNELACMDKTFRFSWNPVPVIQACESSMDGDSAELACLARY